jgi:hypothetical protein
MKNERQTMSEALQSEKSFRWLSDEICIQCPLWIHAETRCLAHRRFEEDGNPKGPSFLCTAFCSRAAGRAPTHVEKPKASRLRRPANNEEIAKTSGTTDRQTLTDYDEVCICDRSFQTSALKERHIARALTVCLHCSALRVTCEFVRVGFEVCIQNTGVSKIYQFRLVVLLHARNGKFDKALLQTQHKIPLLRHRIRRV